MSLVFLVITATTTKNLNFKKNKKRKQSIVAHYISIDQPVNNVLPSFYF